MERALQLMPNFAQSLLTEMCERRVPACYTPVHVGSSNSRLIDMG
jgi:hypothetical protein